MIEIRKEPEDHCLSTLECCTQALLLLQQQQSPSNDVSTAEHYLMSSLRILVDQQLQQKQGDCIPRHVQLRKTSRFEKNKRRYHIQEQLFGGDVLVTHLPDGSTLRKLRHSDAPLIHHYQQQQELLPLQQPPSSLKDIDRQIKQGVACFGVFRGHELCAFLVQDDNKIMQLHVQVEYRRRGYGATLLAAASQVIRGINIEGEAFLVDDLTEQIFEREGWLKENPTLQRTECQKWILVAKKG